MKRYLQSILIALALVGTSGASFSAPALECTMREMSADMDGNRDTMICGALECTIACPSAATLLGETGPQGTHPALEIVSNADVLPFESVGPRIIDPPPRHRSI